MSTAPALTVTSAGHWRLAKPGEKDVSLYLYAIEPAKSSRGRCRKCSECVPKGDLRFGIPIRDPRGEYGYISAWQHLGCTRVEERGEALEPFIAGFAALSSADQKAVVDEITSSVVPEHLKALEADDLVKRGVLERAECPPTMLQHLLPFQLEGLGWMASQELSEYRGGILADEMGMGKTIQTISLLLKNKGNGPTLVVCPVSSMNQWEEEIAKNVTPGALEIARVTKTTSISKEQLMKADVVLTTYPVLELSYRIIVNKSKVPCQYCDKMFLPRQLSSHNRYFCGPNAKKTLKQAKQERTRGSDSDDNSDDIIFLDPEEGSAEGAAKGAKGGRPRTVQSKETILKGLRSLHVDVADLEDAADDTKKEEAKAAKASKGKRGRASSSGGGPTAATDEAPAAPHQAENITGPMSVMRNLMREAGRKVRGRFDQRRGSATDSSEESDGGDASGDDAPRAATRGRRSEAPVPKASKAAGAAKAKESAVEEEANEEDDAAGGDVKPDEMSVALRCDACGFQKLRYPFCPKTGQEHVTAGEEELNRQFLGETGDIGDSVLHSIHWFRIVLDEAHRIKTRTSNTSRSVYSLTADRKWCITGTPLQNRVGDLYSLLRFLQVAPYAKYYCCAKGCSCTSLCHPFSWSSLRACVFCGHGPLHHFSYFNKHIMNPINRLGYVGEGKKALMLLANGVLNALMLRRTKAERSEELRMPPMTVMKRVVALTEAERDMYDSLYKRSASKFDTFVKKGTMLHNYAHIFQLLSRLRQALDHPYLVTRSLGEDVVVGRLSAAAHVCAVCQDDAAPRRSVVVEPCKHAFHAGCLQQYVDGAPEGSKLSCPACFVPITFDVKRMYALAEEGEDGDADEGGGGDGGADDGVGEAGDNDDDDDGDGVFAAAAPPPIGGADEEADDDEDILVAVPPPSTEGAAAAGPSPAEDKQQKKGRKKGAAHQPRAPKGIMGNISATQFVAGSKMKAMLEYIQAVPADEKCIVFSQFGGMLDLLEFYFARFGGLHCVKLTGSQPMPVRQSILNAFRNDKSVRVILISLKAGGEGLNLQNANHVLLSDPWWNPAVEMQAVQRAHRIGQQRHVTAVRFVTENSVEERMIELQDKKMLVFEGTIDGKATSLHRLSEEDMQFLFAR